MTHGQGAAAEVMSTMGGIGAALCRDIQRARQLTADADAYEDRLFNRIVDEQLGRAREQQRRADMSLVLAERDELRTANAVLEIQNAALSRKIRDDANELAVLRELVRRLRAG